MRKKDRDNRLTKNYRTMSLLNVDLKIHSKDLSEKLKEVLPTLISWQQTAYVRNRDINIIGRLISDTIETAKLNLESFLVVMDIEKGFESLDHTFLISFLKKYGFDQNFFSWIKTLLKKIKVLCYQWSKSHLIIAAQRSCPWSWPNVSFLFYFRIRNIKLLPLKQGLIEKVLKFLIIVTLLSRRWRRNLLNERCAIN